MPIFDSRFLKFLFRISGGINCWDPVEDSDTGGLSSVTVRMDTYVLFSNDIVNFAYKPMRQKALFCQFLFFGGA